MHEFNRFRELLIFLHVDMSGFEKNDQIKNQTYITVPQKKIPAYHFSKI